MPDKLPFDAYDRLTIPGVLPSVNHMYVNARIKNRNMRVLTKEAEHWKTSLILSAIAWKNKNRWRTVPKKTKTVVQLWYYFPDWKTRDSHNTLKLLLDCFEDAGIYENDMYALPRVMDMQIDKEHPRVEISFEVMAA